MRRTALPLPSLLLFQHQQHDKQRLLAIDVSSVVQSAVTLHAALTTHQTSSTCAITVAQPWSAFVVPSRYCPSRCVVVCLRVQLVESSHGTSRATMVEPCKCRRPVFLYLTLSVSAPACLCLVSILSILPLLLVFKNSARIKPRASFS